MNNAEYGSMLRVDLAEVLFFDSLRGAFFQMTEPSAVHCF